MLSSKEIRNVKFSKSVGGYKQEEVDVLLDKIEADYEQFERTLREMSSKIEELRAETEEYKNSQGSIQNVLVSAQKLADQIVEEAKNKSAEIVSNAQMSIEKITAKEQELAANFDKKAGERMAGLESDVEKVLSAAESKQTAIQKATDDCVNRQQVLFEKIKLEIAAFKADITNKYKQHLEVLSKLPDTVPSDPKEIAAILSANIEAVPDVRAFVEKKPIKQETVIDEPVTSYEEQEPEQVEEMGFTVNIIDDDDDNNDDEQE